MPPDSKLLEIADVAINETEKVSPDLSGTPELIDAVVARSGVERTIAEMAAYARP